MPLTTYTAGQVLTASSLNANLQYLDAKPAGMALLASGSFTTATSFSLANSTFTSTYDHYKLIVRLSAVSAPCNVTIRLRASGSDDSTSNYQRMFLGVTNGGGASNGTSSGATNFVIADLNNTVLRFGLTFDVLSPNVATQTIVAGQYTYVDSAASGYIGRTGSGMLNTTTQYDSLSFISDVASSLTGSYSILGYAK